MCVHRRTRVKICGVRRAADVQSAADAGADAVGLVFYPPSPRYLEPAAAGLLARSLPPFMSAVALFVNADPARVHAVLAQVPTATLQFHGDESADYCRSFGRPYIKAVRMRPQTDLLECARTYADAVGLLLDADTESFGGAGKQFDWSWAAVDLPLPMVLSGGLNPDNVAAAIRRLRPWAVDVSSGVESAKGIKDAGKIARFLEEVRCGDAPSADSGAV